MSYRLRFPSSEEEKFMINIFKKYVEEKNLNNDIKLYFGFISYYYEESRTKYFINLEIDSNNTLNPRIGVNYHISKKNIKEYLTINNITKPKFPKANLIK